jgi:hypothetical protein
MQKRVFVLVFLFVLMCVSLPVLSKDKPLIKYCEPIHLKSSEGWWVSINDDGSGAYGFGAGLARIKVVKNTFSYEKVYSVLAKAINNTAENTQEPHMVVSCATETNRLPVEHNLAQDKPLLTALFQLARENSHPPTNKFETRSHYHVKSFLKESPWDVSPCNVSPCNVSHHILLNTANAKAPN